MKLLKVKEAAERLSCTPEHVQSLIRAGDLEAINVARATVSRPLWRVTDKALDRFVRDRAAAMAPSKPRRRRRSRSTDATEYV